MVYKNFKNLKLSALGMGCMRLPVIDNNDSNIDEQKTAEMVAYAMKNGINYYDTAWGYHNGNSEIVMGNVLSKYPRENYYLATKFPGYDISNMDKVEQIFEKQLEKCQVEYDIDLKVLFLILHFEMSNQYNLIVFDKIPYFLHIFLKIFS